MHHSDAFQNWQKQLFHILVNKDHKKVGAWQATAKEITELTLQNY